MTEVNPIMNEVLKPARNMSKNIRNSYLTSNHPFQKSSTGQNSLFYIDPAIRGRISKILKRTKSSNTFKHNINTI